MGVVNRTFVKLCNKAYRAYATGTWRTVEGNPTAAVVILREDDGKAIVITSDAYGQWFATTVAKSDYIMLDATVETDRAEIAALLLMKPDLEREISRWGVVRHE
jgi:hypothetical protein